MQVNVLEVVSRACTDDRITSLHPTIRTSHKHSSDEKHVEGTKNNLNDPSNNLSIVDLLFFHGRCFSMFFKVIIRRNGKKGNKDACKI